MAVSKVVSFGRLVWMRFFAVFLPLVLLPVLSAQEPAPASPLPDSPQPQISDVKSLPSDIVHDQAAIWTSPAHIRASDLKWLLLVAALAGVSIAEDRRFEAALPGNSTQIAASKDISYLATYGVATALGSSLVVGKLTHNARLWRAGLLASESLADAQVVGQSLKYVTRRERPDHGSGNGHFWAGGDSFPSGHAITIWSVAPAFAAAYPDHRWVRYGVYGLATAVSMARITSREHFPSDVVAGSTLGFVIGEFVVHRHHRFEDEPQHSSRSCARSGCAK